MLSAEVEAVSCLLELRGEYPAFKIAAMKADERVGEPTMTAAQRQKMATAIRKAVEQRNLLPMYQAWQRGEIPYGKKYLGRIREDWCKDVLAQLRTKK